MNEVCWKCGLPITEDCPDDGMTYTSSPVQFAHAECPIKDKDDERKVRERYDAPVGPV